MTRKEITTKYGKSIIQLPNGRYYIRLKIDGVTKQIARSTPEGVIDGILETLRGDSLKKSSVPTFCEFAKLWKPVRQNSCSGGAYNKTCRYLRDFWEGSELGKMYVTQYTVFDVNGFLSHCRAVKGGKLTHSVWKDIMNTMSQMIKCAQKNYPGVPNHFLNFQTNADTFHKAKQKELQCNRYFSEAEIKQIGELALSLALKKSQANGLGIILVGETGLRDGELCEIRWKDLEDRTGALHVCREQVEVAKDEEGRHGGYTVVNHAKTEAGDRFIPLTEKAKEVLALTKELNRRAGIPTGSDDLIFMSEKGSLHPCNIRTFDSKIMRLCRDCGLPRKSMHDLRRGFATRCYYKGIPLRSIQTWMVHATETQTQAYIIQDKISITDAFEIDKLNT